MLREPVVLADKIKFPVRRELSENKMKEGIATTFFVREPPRYIIGVTLIEVPTAGGAERVYVYTNGLPTYTIEGKFT